MLLVTLSSLAVACATHLPVKPLSDQELNALIFPLSPVHEASDFKAPTDEFSSALHAYREAVGRRVDNGEITEAEGDALIAELQVRITAERARVRAAERAAKAQAQAVDISARQARWANFWQLLNYSLGVQQLQQQRQLGVQQLQPQRLLRQQPRMTPINCSTHYFKGSAQTTCY